MPQIVQDALAKWQIHGFGPLQVLQMTRTLAALERGQVAHDKERVNNQHEHGDKG
jgi:hypothetical protein